MKWILLSSITILLSAVSVNAQDQTTLDELKQQLSTAIEYLNAATAKVTEAEKAVKTAETEANAAATAVSGATSISEELRLKEVARKKAARAEAERTEAIKARAEEATAAAEVERLREQLAEMEAKEAIIVTEGVSADASIGTPEKVSASRGQISVHFAGCEDLAKEEHGNISIIIYLETGVDKYNAEKKKTETIYEDRIAIGSGSLYEGFSLLVNDPKPGKYRIVIGDSDKISDIFQGGIREGDALIASVKIPINTTVQNNIELKVNKTVNKKGVAKYTFK